MLSEPGNPRGLAVVCDDLDIVTEVLKNDFRLAEDLASGDLVTAIFEEQNQDKALQFLHEARSEGAAFDWELVVSLAGAPAALHCAAARLEGGLLVIVAGTRDSTLRMIEEMLRVSNEQTNSMRLLIKELQVSSQKLGEKDRNSYNELTSLNSQMASMQRELIKKNLELAELNQQKNYLLGMAAHDLRTPLNSIALMCQYLEMVKTPELDPETCQMIQTIHQSSRFMARLLNETLDFAQIESGQVSLHQTRFPLGAFLDKIVKLNASLAHPEQVEISASFRHAPETAVHWDAVKIEQVINNLLGNAVKFSPRGSRVTVTSAVQGQEVLLEVSDQGAGIAAGELPHLSTPFKAGRKGHRGEKSIGLGLAIARRIVLSHGGSISVDSSEGVGTTFTVTLPLEPA